MNIIAFIKVLLKFTKRIVLGISLLFISATLFSGCKKKEHQEFIVSVSFENASKDPIIKQIELADTLFQFNVLSDKNTENDVDVTIGVDFSLVSSFNEINQTTYKPLPNNSFTLSTNKASISTGALKSLPITLLINPTGTLQRGNNYLLPVTIKNTSSNATINESHSVNYFVISVIEAKSIKVLTYNIRHANPPSAGTKIDLPAIASVIRDSGAELIALQEVDVYTDRAGKTSNQARELAVLLDMHYYFAKSIDYQGGQYGVAILSKHPLNSTYTQSLPMAPGETGEPRVVAIATVTPHKGKPIIFACTHFDLNEKNKVLQAQALASYASNQGLPIVLCGDFNATPDSETIAILDPVFQRSSVTGGYTIPATNPRREIDYIMFSPKSHFEIQHHQVIDERYASDHLPVYVELSY